MFAGLTSRVQNAGIVRGGEPVGDANQQLDGLAPTSPRGVCPILERAAVDELCDQILTAVELARIVHRENVWVIQGGSHLRFALEAAARRRVGKFVGENLDGDRTIEMGIDRPIHDAHAAGADRGLQLVRPDPRACQDGWLITCAATAAAGVFRKFSADSARLSSVCTSRRRPSSPRHSCSRNAPRSRDGRSSAE
jgi:hypothetical protein